MRNPMFVFDEKMADLVLGYCRQRLALDPVPLDYGGYAASLPSSLRDVLGGLISPEGNDPARVLELFSDHLATAVISADSPRYLSFIPAAPTKASLLFDMVVSSGSLHGTSWLEAAGAVAAENQVLTFLAELAGLPKGAGGCFVSGGSAANLSALMVARDTASLRGNTTQRPRIACTDEAHSSVGKALHVLGVEPFLVPAVDHRLSGEVLEAALSSDQPGAADVVGVVATAGTTNAGLIDDLSGVGAVARRRGLWFHVDGAYGCGALLSPAARPLFDGMELVDSFVVDPHKWLFAPYDCAALIYRQPALAKAVHTQDAAYLDVIHVALPGSAGAGAAGAGDGEAGTTGAGPGAAGSGAETDTGDEPWNPTDYAYHLSRRARGLPLWFSLAVYGTDAYRDAVETALANARAAAALISATPYLELVREPTLSIVLFRRKGWSRSDYENWSARLLADQVAFVTPTSWEGEPTARFALLHPDTTADIVREIIETMA
ncbi:MAG: pyridoxal-dependent decarboxylase [Actinomycetota bacterium]|jgi:glutamate/tyrosine decarboxylase-like PLP-dependent enzyme|nr:pyridoxal-dependent decarboxylase [Actinomycetota bacterium]MDA8313883.1 pyridoxal-dependent decarboxylase [Actinomycetota bacterium]